MRVTGYVVLWNVHNPEIWGIAHANNHILIGETLEEARQLVFDEREMNEPDDWVYPNVRIMDLTTGTQYELQVDDSLKLVEPVVTH